MSDTKHLQRFGTMAGKAYALGALKLAFKRRDGEDEGSEQPGASVDLHRHDRWQETFIVLEGRFDFDAANNDPALDARAVFERHGLELL